MRICLLGILCLIILQPGFGRADAPYDSWELIQKIPYGYVNWSQGILVVKSTVDAATPTNSDSISDAAIREQLTRKIFQSLSHICVDAHHSLWDIININPEIQDKLNRIARTTPIHARGNTENGTVEMAIRLQLYGGFSQLMLPSGIRQVESIKAIGDGPAVAKGGGGAVSPEDAAEEIYTGLIVDARNIGVQPALVPVLVDENNSEVYGAAFVSREFAVQQGMCGYARFMREADSRRVGQHPLMIKGMRRSSRGPCDIVISNSDAAKLRSASAHLAFLKQCRVVILSD